MIIIDRFIIFINLVYINIFCNYFKYFNNSSPFFSNLKVWNILHSDSNSGGRGKY